jgi:two-component system response regulator VanR/two-component system response regulator Irr
MANIIVVDDEKYTNDIICNFLKSAGHDVLQAYDGVTAITMFSDDVDLMILDMMLPDMTGMDILDTIRIKSRDVIIIMLSAVGDEVTQLTSFNKEADEYIVKPFSPSLLVKKVEMLLKRISKSRCGNKGTCIRGICFDFESYSASLKGEKIDFTAKEIEFIKLLHEEHGNVLSRQQIINKLWNDEYDVLDRTIDVHVKNIRKKTNEDFITTVKGVGYRMEPET